MSFFRSNIDPFCSFTINLGPLYVERVFDSLLTLQGAKNVVRMNPIDRLENYLDYLRAKISGSNREQYSFIQFYKGHFYQQLAAHQTSADTTSHLRVRSLCAYQEYLDLSSRSEESRYYAQWQTGVLQEILKYPWSLTEQAYLLASSMDTLRGEPIKQLVAHYMAQRDWRTAYSLSSAAIKKFFGKDPAALRSWYIDHNAYNWIILNTHVTICYKLGLLSEAQQAYGRMHNYELTHPDEFSDLDLRHNHFLEKVLYPSKTLFASAS